MGAEDRPTTKLLSVAEAARRTGLSYYTMLQEVRTGQLPALRLGTGYYKIDPDELAKYAKRLKLVMTSNA